MQYSKEFYTTRENMLKQYSKSQTQCNKDVYRQLLRQYEITGPIQHSNINYDVLHRLYIVENIEEASIAKLYGLSTSGLIAKRRRLGIADKQSEFELVLRATEMTIDKLGTRAFKK